jgi:HEPN domain-containing protein
MASRAADWLRQAQRDLRHAEHAFEDGDYEWACFAAQQAAEKALKAVYQKMGAEARGHSVTALIGSLPQSFPPAAVLLEKAKVLDKYYIPTRYPNSFERGIPGEYFTADEAKGAISFAREILEFSGEIVGRESG